MIDVSIQWEDQITDRIKKFGENAGDVLDIILRGLSKNFRNHVRKRELSGQMLRRCTGELQESVHHGKLRGAHHVFVIGAMPKLANIYEHVGGAVIKAKKAKMLRWYWWGFGAGGQMSQPGAGARPMFAKQVAIPYRPFMTRGVASFDFSGGFVTVANKVLAKEMKRQGLSDEK